MLHSLPSSDNSRNSQKARLVSVYFHGKVVIQSNQWRKGPRRRLADSAFGLPAGTCCHIYAATFARFGRAIFGPMHPLCSIRRFHGCGVSRPIALHTCQLLKPTAPYPGISVVRSRRPALSEFASEIPPSLSWRNNRGLPATRSSEHAPRRADLDFRCIMSHVASQSGRSAGETPSERSLRGDGRRSDGKGDGATRRSCSICFMLSRF
jgi:hypothetical protein